LINEEQGKQNAQFPAHLFLTSPSNPKMKKLLFALFIFSLWSCGKGPSKNSVDAVEFFGDYDVDSMKLTLNGEDYVFATEETVYDTIRGFDFNIRHQRLGPYCMMLTSESEGDFLLTMETPDFNGPVVNIMDINREEPKRTLSVQGDPIEVFSENAKSYVVIQSLLQDPGFQDGYDIFELPLFELYELKSGTLEIDKKASHDYNLKHTPDFERISKMENPVLGFKEGKREIIEAK
jgi:hypothetical protein